MTETESLIAEVRQLRADVARLHAAVQVRHSWMNLLFKDLSTNPHTQYKVHMWGAIYWLINFVGRGSIRGAAAAADPT
jgi:hypothetical protein